jgi:hypothetical protein
MMEQEWHDQPQRVPWLVIPAPFQGQQVVVSADDLEQAVPVGD